MGAVSLASNLKEGNYGSAALDVAGLVLDVGAMVVPGAPGGAGSILKASRASAKAADAVLAMKSAENIVDLGSTAKKVGAACTCFVEETEILMPEEARPIVEVQAGDVVLAHEPESEEEWISIEALEVLQSCDPDLDPDCVLSAEVPHE